MPTVHCDPCVHQALDGVPTLFGRRLFHATTFPEQTEVCTCSSVVSFLFNHFPTMERKFANVVYLTHSLPPSGDRGRLLRLTCTSPNPTTETRSPVLLLSA